MAIEKVQLGVTLIKDLLAEGFTWLKKDDLGFGSIQEKFQASDVQITAIRKHPLLKDLETTARVFIIIDDTKNATTTVSPVEPQNADSVECLPSNDAKSTKNEAGRTESVSEPVHDSFEGRVFERKNSDDEQVAESASAFFNL